MRNTKQAYEYSTEHSFVQQLLRGKISSITLYGKWVEDWVRHSILQKVDPRTIDEAVGVPYDQSFPGHLPAHIYARVCELQDETVTPETIVPFLVFRGQWRIENAWGGEWVSLEPPIELNDVRSLCHAMTARAVAAAKQ